MFLKGCFYAGAFLCSLLESSVFNASDLFGMHACHVFPQCVLVIMSLTGGEIEASLMTQWVKNPSVMQETQV